MARWERVALVGVLVVAGLGAATVASVAMGGFLYFLTPEEEPDWSTQPIEVVVTESERTCGFNVEAVAPGRHDIVVIPNDADSVVVIRDPSGRTVLRQAAEVGAVGVSNTVRLRVGTYDVRCRTEGATMAAKLPVVPAAELG